MRIQTIHRNPMGDVLNECSAHGFRITTENGDVYDINAEGGMVTIQTRGCIVNLAHLQAEVRGDVRYDRELIAQMLDAAEAPAFSMEEMDTQARLLREAAQAKPEAQCGEELPSPLNGDFDCPKAAAARSCPCGFCRAMRTPSAPVGVDYAKRLATSLWQRHYRDDAPQWEPFDDLPGLLSQIDNMVSGLTRAPALAQQPAAVDEAAAIRAFEEHFNASADDPYFEGELELWLTAWRKALAQQPPAEDWGLKTCYQCNRPVTWLAPDSRCVDCTRLTPDEVGG